MIARVLTLALMAAGLPLGARAADATLTVIVRSGDELIAGASVRVGLEQRTTDANGRALLTLEPGDYEVAVEAPGYLPGAARAVLPPGSPHEVSVELRRSRRT